MTLHWVQGSSANLMPLSHILILSCLAELDSSLNYLRNLLEQGTLIFAQPPHMIIIAWIPCTEDPVYQTNYTY